MGCLAVVALAAMLAGCGGGGSSSSPSSSNIPATPTGLAATAGNAQVALAWNSSANATGYNLYFSTNSSVSVSSGSRLAVGSATAYTHSGLTNGLTYSYIVTALDSAGESAASLPVSATPASPLPAPPTGLSAIAGNGQINLSWNAVAEAISYNLYYSTSPAMTASSATKITGLTDPSYSLTGLANGTPYYLMVSAVNASGESPPSPIVSATPADTLILDLEPGSTASGTLPMPRSPFSAPPMPFHPAPRPPSIHCLRPLSRRRSAPRQSRPQRRF